MNGRNMEIKEAHRNAFKKAAGGKWYLEKYFRISHLERHNCYYKLNKGLIEDENSANTRAIEEANK